MDVQGLPGERQVSLADGLGRELDQGLRRRCGS
jgi:hypothetical protein